MPDLAERTLELAKEALGEQERHVADLRARAAVVLGAGGVAGGLLGPQVLASPHPDGTAGWLATGVGLAGALVLVVCGVAAFTLREVAFSANARRTHEWLVRNDVTEQPAVDLHLAFAFVRTREHNDAAVAVLRRSVSGLLVGFATLLFGFGVAAALGS
jgi:uncharacterized membrane protein YbaN (DUF454 family)